MNDTVLGDPQTDPDIKGYTAGYFAGLPPDARLTWRAQRINGALGPREQEAAEKAAAHAGTPSTAYFDPLGRPFLTTVHNKVACPGHQLDGTEGKLSSRVEQDIEGNTRAVRDAVIQGGDGQGRVVTRYDYDMLGNLIFQLSMDAGARWLLNDVSGNPIHTWDSRGRFFRTEYDPLRRPVRFYVTGADPAHPGRELLVERLVYGEQHPEAVAYNLHGMLYLHLDQAGAVINEAYDFKGNLLRVSRRLTNGEQYREVVDWRAVDANYLALPPDAAAKINLKALAAELTTRLERDIYSTSTGYDALNRPVAITTPHAPGLKPSIIRPGYNEANLLERVEVNLHGAVNDGLPVWTPFVTKIDYDAKGRRRQVDYGNGVSTFYEYDPFTFRLTHLVTRRNPVSFPGDSPQPPPAGWPGCQVQNLSYTYDPVGNITYIRDNAQQTVYFRNKRVAPDAAYTYDALYHLIEATGREHLGQNNGTLKPPAPHSSSDAPRIGLSHPGDGNAMGTYIERYVYDAAGNILQMKHRGSDPASPGWTRAYTYTEASLIEPRKTSNRLTSTIINNNNGVPVRQHYVYDAHGNVTRMPHFAAHADATLPNMHWDFQDRLQQVDLGGGGTVYYVYDAGGQRIRKVWEKATHRIEEHIYLGIFEIYRRLQGAELLERETLHIMDNQHRIALVETRTRDTAGIDVAPPLLIRYQFANHLGSANLELDDQAQVISYEEYFPYGNTSYQATRSQTETPKRYRYTGKERDEESGFYYHGARYYAPWLGRWMSCDPKNNQNLYSYGRENPVFWFDPSGRDDQPVAKVWNDAIEGAQVISKGISQTATAAGKFVQELAEVEASILRKAGFNRLAKLVNDIGVVRATITSTAVELAGQALAAGPNLISGLDSAGTNIGEGLGRAIYGETTEEKLSGAAQLSSGIAEGALASIDAMTMKKGVQFGRLKPSRIPGEHQVRANQRLGRQFEKEAKRHGSKTSEQLRIQPLEPLPPDVIGPRLIPARKPDGKPLIRIIDTAERSRSGRLKLIELKSTKTARYTAQQQLADELISKYGGVIRSRKASIIEPLGLKYGDAIPPTIVNVFRNTDLANRYLLGAIITNLNLSLYSDLLSRP